MANRKHLRDNAILEDVYDDTNGLIKVGPSGFFSAPSAANAVTVTYPSATQEVYRFRTGGTSGTILMTITIDYVDSTKEEISTVVKS